MKLGFLELLIDSDKSTEWNSINIRRNNTYQPVCNPFMVHTAVTVNKP